MEYHIWEIVFSPSLSGSDSIYLVHNLLRRHLTNKLSQVAQAPSQILSLNILF